MSSCPKCGATVGRRPGPGRPAVYCGPACRSVASYELRRVQKRLEEMEVRRGELRQLTPEDIEIGIGDAWGRDLPQQLAALEAEIAEAEDRLRVLLNEPRGTTLADKEQERYEAMVGNE